MKRTESQHKVILEASISMSFVFMLTGCRMIGLLIGSGACLLLGVLLAKDYDNIVRRKNRAYKKRIAVCAIEKSREIAILNAMHLMDEWRKS